MLVNTLPTRLADKIAVEATTGCWLWIGAKNQAGYGVVSIGPKGRRVNKRAHRLVYEALIDAIPDDKQIDHLCRVKACVNPAHLEVVTPAVNVLRGVGPTAQNARKTHCPRGHALEGSNILMNGKGYRSCRTCVYVKNNERAQARRAAQRASRQAN